MASSDDAPITFRVPGRRVDGARRGAAMPALPPPLGLGGTVRESVRLAAVRSGGNLTSVVADPGSDVVVLHIADGPSLVLNPATARDLLMAQSDRPLAPSRGGARVDGAPRTVDVAPQLQWRGLENPAIATAGIRRGVLGDVVLSGIDVITGVFSGKAEDIVASELVGRIDSQVVEGVYALRPEALNRLKTQTPVATMPDAGGEPTLVFVHGTFSETTSGFEKLWTQHPERVRTLFKHYGNRVFALDHRTVGVSPIENALSLAQACPQGARLHLVTHSRGGLVAEVLARAGALAALAPEDLATFDGEPLAAQRTALVQLVALMARRDIKVGRIVRVACPARGTFLASKRFDAYLSVVVWALKLANVPVLPALVDFLGGVAQRRQDPEEMPGLAAMIPDSPLIQWLHAADEPASGDLRVVAGDLDGDSIGSWVKTLMADAFYWTDNDLVVQTRSMYGGTPRGRGADFVLDQGGRVTHFNYFGNERTAEAVVNGLLQPVPAGFLPIGPLSFAGESAGGVRGRQRAVRAADDQALPGTRPAVFLLPGILGSNLKVNGKRIWLGARMLNGLKRLAYPDLAGLRVEPDGPVGMTYDSLVSFLSQSHEVIEFPFDWRKPLESEAERLGKALGDALDAREASAMPVRIVAHSMGGLVARVMALQCPQVWERMLANDGARLLMLGTPNAGSWAPMQVLSGDDSFGNTLIAFGAPFQDHSARQMMAQFPGFLQLQSNLLDESHGLRRQETWEQLARDDLERVRRYNWWHTDERQLVPYRWGVPEQAILDQAVALRQRLDAQVRDALPAFRDRLLLVVGRADFTPAGFEVGEQGLTYLNATESGDGRVLLSSALLPGVKTWRVASEHGKLPDTREAFEAYLELLETGTTGRLAPQEVAARGGPDAAGVAPVALVRGRPARQPLSLTVPQSEDAVMQLLAPATAAGVATRAMRLAVTVRNGDLRFVREPLLVGHYRSSAFGGTEQIVNQLIGATMEQSLAMGQYPNEPGTHQLFVNRAGNGDNPWLMPRPEAAVVVGLGEEGKLKSADFALTVRMGVLALAQWRMERPEGAPPHFEIAAALLGSGGVGIGPGQAAQMIAQGVRDANAVLRENNRRLAAASEQRRRDDPLRGSANEPMWPLVSRLHFVERYMDRASEAWRALRIQAEGAAGEFEVAAAVTSGTGALRRPPDGGYRGSDYDLISAISSEDAGGDKRILYTIDTKRARSEVRAQSTQLRLVRELVARASTDRTDRADDVQIGRTLFQLLVPLEVEPFLGGSSETRLELDRGTAGIPWEMLDTGDRSLAGASDNPPWAIRTKLLRKLRVDDFRQRVVDATVEASALVIGEPATDGGYPRLPGARREATAVARLLMGQDALRPERVRQLISPDNEPAGSGAGSPGPDASEVINALLSREWRIVHIAGHGEAPRRAGADPARPDGGAARDSASRGVVLTNETFLGPREICNMRVVPELVFVNCCHLAARDTGQLLQTENELVYDRASFASGVAEELIKIGVHCVVAAGWAVEDGPAAIFATTFYESLLRGDRFIDAVCEARKAAHREKGKTWAAYQCYGDPNWVLRREGGQLGAPAAQRSSEFEDLPSPIALTLALESIAVDARLDARAEAKHRDRIQGLESAFRFRWGGIGAVAEAFAVAWQATGARAEAVAWYERAIGANDGSASLKAGEQLASLKVLQAWGAFAEAPRPSRRANEGSPEAGRALNKAAAAARSRINAAITDIDRLLSLHPTLERYSLRGAANKRLAMVERAVGNAAAAEAALSRMVADYADAERVAARSGALALVPYPLQNRLAAEAALRAGAPDWSGPDPKVLAELRRSLLEKVDSDPDFWGVVGLAELQILEALAGRSLAMASRHLIAQLADLHARVKAASDWMTVYDQMEFLLASYADRVGDAAEAEAAEMLKTQVRAYAAGD